MTTATNLAHFALEPPMVEGEWVTRKGKIFELGNYEDKLFSLDEDEADSAIADFSPVPLDIEHAPSLLDSKLGNLTKVWRQGKNIYGETMLPVWLDKALEGTDRTVSCTWDRNTKRLQKLALVRTPRVSDAILMSSYADFAARHDTPHGQQALQDIHNASVRGGAVCKATNTAAMSSTHEAKTMQAVHDLTTEHGAVCQSIPPNAGKPWAESALPSYFSMIKDGTMTIKDFLTGMKESGIIEDEPLAPIAAPAPVAPVQPQAQPAPTFSAAPTVNAEELAAAKAKSDALVAEFAAEKAKSESQAAEFAAIKAENARLKAERIQKDAEHEAEALIVAHKADPVERDAIVALFAQAATDDTVYGVVTFSAADGSESKTSRVEQVKALFAARTAHERNVELIPDREGAANGAAFRVENPTTTRQAGQEKPLDEAETKRLLALMNGKGAHVSASFGAN